MRDELKTRRNAGESNLIIRGNKLVTRAVRKEKANSQAEAAVDVDTADEHIGRVSTEQ